MKSTFLKLSLILFVLASCGSKVTDFSQLQDRNGIVYIINSDKPFTGKVLSKNQGILEFEGYYKNGLRDKQWVFYHPNGQKYTEGTYIDGAKDGIWPIWKENGVLEINEIYKFGTLVVDNTRLNNQASESSESENEQNNDKQVASTENQQSNQGTQEETRTEERRVQYVDWEQLRGGSRKTLNGAPYTGGFIKYFRGGRTRELVGHYNNGYRSGKWTYYNKNGTVKDVRYY